jgi:Ca2+-binding EF-hand superfamily protein
MGFKRVFNHDVAVSKRKQPQHNRNSRNNVLSRHIETIFKEADTNHDGHVDIDEAYALALKLYIYMNRQAPVPPPTPEQVRRLFATADADRNGRLDWDEFRRLMLSLYARSSTRIVAYKTVRFVVAPLLALHTCATVVRLRGRSDFLPEIAWLERVCWRTVAVVAFSACLGNVALYLADFFLDTIQLQAERRKNDKKNFPFPWSRPRPTKSS